MWGVNSAQGEGGNRWHVLILMNVHAPQQWVPIDSPTTGDINTIIAPLTTPTTTSDTPWATAVRKMPVVKVKTSPRVVMVVVMRVHLSIGCNVVDIVVVCVIIARVV